MSLVEIEAGVRPTLATVFAPALQQALENRSGVNEVRIRMGRNLDEVLVSLDVVGQPPLPLYFPRASALDGADVLRIVSNVLEGMGPVAPWAERRGPVRPALD